MNNATDLSPVERLIELHAILELKGRQDQAVGQKDWDTYANLHTDDYVAMSIAINPIVGGRAAANALAGQMANGTTVHHCHTPVIEFQDRDNATGVWAMETTFSESATARSSGSAGSASTTRLTYARPTGSGGSATGASNTRTRKRLRAPHFSPLTSPAKTRTWPREARHGTELQVCSGN